MLHGDSFKIRWFVLARVPHATVLIYYDRKCMDEDHILGYIDMRRVVAIREGVKLVSVDVSRSSVKGLFTKLRSMMGPSSDAQVSRPVIELVTTQRTYLLCPASVEVPPAVSIAAAAGPSLYGKPLYLCGWPFPVPHLDGAVMSSGPEDAAAVDVDFTIQPASQRQHAADKVGVNAAALALKVVDLEGRLGDGVVQLLTGRRLERQLLDGVEVGARQPRQFRRCGVEHFQRPLTDEHAGFLDHAGLGRRLREGAPRLRLATPRPSGVSAGTCNAAAAQNS
jgi:hypothetical protein